MEQLVYKPDIYEGKDPYIFMSYHPADRARVLDVLEKLDQRGFRFWLNDGIAPGMEADDVIAEHIENCESFIAFLSGEYLASLDTVDELNYSRDVNKEYLLVYLENVALPAGLDMRFNRAQSVNAVSLDGSGLYEQLVNIQGASRFYGIADERLRPKAEKVFGKLHELYPEHKVFALNAVGKSLSKEISELYVTAGYPSADRLMQDYGFIQISTEEARVLRSSVLYQPGYEPDAIKARVETIVNTLAADYPDKIITDNLSKSHKSIYSSIQGLSVWLGYASAADMMTAYGFSGLRSDRGRTVTDHDQILQLLSRRYEGKKKPCTLSKVMSDNPDLKSGLKTLSNNAAELFGMPLLQYLRREELIAPREKQEATTKTAKNRERLISRIQDFYDAATVNYGSFEDVRESIQGIVLKENIKGNLYVTDCSTCGETVRLPLGIDFVSEEAFAGQSDIAELILPPTLREIQEAAFMDCSGIEHLVFSEGIERIGNSAFAGCSSLRSVSFPASLKFIGSEAFAGCEALEEVTFGNPRINIQEDAFDGCIYSLDDLQDSAASPAEYFELKVDRKNTAKILAYTGDEEVVVIPAMIAGHPITSIEKGCFKGNEYVREIYIHDSIGAINGDAFKDCVNLEKVHISNAVSKFTATAFAGCTSLAEVNIPDSMTDVTRGLFKDAPLTTVYIGKGVKNLSPDAFYKGEADFATGLYLKKKVLEHLEVSGENPWFSAAGTALLSKDGKQLVAELGDPVVAVIPEGVEEICPMAYDKITSFCEVEFPSTLKRIGEKAFAGTCLTHAEFPVSLQSIGVQAFSFCRSLSRVEFYDGLQVISQQAFEGCPILDVYIPASVTTLGSDSFLAISTFQGNVDQRLRIDSANVNLADDGVALYVKAEEGWELLKAYRKDLRPMPNEAAAQPIAYSVKEGTKKIAAHAFARCSALASVELPEGLLAIGDMAFWDCRGLTEIHIPQSCTSVSAKAFFGININKV